MNQRSISAYWERQERNNSVIPQYLDDTPKTPVLESFLDRSIIGVSDFVVFLGQTDCIEAGCRRIM